MKRNTHPLSPRNWPLWFGFGLLRVIILLPYPWIMGLGRQLGRLFYRFAKRRVHIARVNIGVCFPELTETEREALVKANFESTGMGLMEVGMGWWMGTRRMKGLVEVEGADHIATAYAQNKGVIFLTAHFSALEMSGRILSWYADFIPMYRPHENPVVEYFVRTYRTKRVALPIPREDVRRMIRTLKENRGVWFAPDQYYGDKGAEQVHFFGIPTKTNPATARFAKMTGALVIPYVLLRKPNNRGYLMQVDPPLADYPTGDMAADAQRINDRFEDWARMEPSQYNWMHRRFKDKANHSTIYD